MPISAAPTTAAVVVLARRSVLGGVRVITDSEAVGGTAAAPRAEGSSVNLAAGPRYLLACSRCCARIKHFWDKHDFNTVPTVDRDPLAHA